MLALFPFFSHASLVLHLSSVSTVYDITARDTFESLSSWINELDTFAGTGPASREVVRMIVGNKVDKVSQAGCRSLLRDPQCTNEGVWSSSPVD